MNQGLKSMRGILSLFNGGCLCEFIYYLKVLCDFRDEC